MCALVTGIQTGARPIYRGAIDRRGDDAERVLERGDVEAREMEQLEPRGVGQDRLEHRRVIGAAGTKADEMLVAAAVAALDQAQPGAQRVQPHGLGVAGRSEERRVGKEGVSTCRSGWS